MSLRAIRDGHLVAPTETGQRATCDECGHDMSARVGRTVIPYWAHLPGRERECAADDRDYMSPWHLAWQSLAPPEHREVRWGPRRGDVLLPDGTCLEVQHSPMPAQEIRDRTDFWVSETGGITWIFDATQSSIERRKDKRGNDYVYWPNGRGSIWDAFPYAIPKGVRIVLDTTDLGLIILTRLWHRLDGQPGRLRASFRELDREAVTAYIERRSPIAA